MKHTCIKTSSPLTRAKGWVKSTGPFPHGVVKTGFGETEGLVVVRGGWGHAWTPHPGAMWLPDHRVARLGMITLLSACRVLGAMLSTLHVFFSSLSGRSHYPCSLYGWGNGVWEVMACPDQVASCTQGQIYTHSLGCWPCWHSPLWHWLEGAHSVGPGPGSCWGARPGCWPRLAPLQGPA